VRWLLAAVAVLAVTPVHADPADLITRPLVLDEGAVDLRITTEINVQSRFVGRPLSVAPDAWWGILPRWTIGVIHSNASLDQIGSGATLCVRQSDNATCNRLYRGSGLDVRFSALAGSFAVAPRLRLLVRDIDPFKPAMTLGAVLRWTRSRFAIVSDPYLRLPLANHSLGNRAALVLPIWLAVEPVRGCELAVHTGYDASLAVFRDGGHIPVSLVITQRITRNIDLGVEGGWAALLGPQHDHNRGTVMITGGWHR
jgi:hypothetical protein